jgi:hypothetical protein
MKNRNKSAIPLLGHLLYVNNRAYIGTYLGLPDGIALFHRKERNRIHDTQFLYMQDYSRTVNVQAKE